MLIEDVFIIENLQVLNEGKNGPMRVRGVFQRADEEHNNKRIYPKALLEREITKLEESMKNRRLMGELDHPQHDSVKLSNVSHLITKLEAKGNDIIGEAEILDTPMGKVAKALIEGGVQIGISSRGMGTLSEGSDGKRYVNEDFRLITWDLVADPSTRGAFPALAESRQSVLVEEIMNDVLPRVTKQKVFSTLLEERLDEKLKGKQHKIDKNKNGKIDSEDFKMLRKESTNLQRVKAMLSEKAKGDKNNAWAICTAKVGRDNPEKYESCVKQVKSKNENTSSFSRVQQVLSEMKPLTQDGKVNAPEKAKRTFKLSPKSQAELHRRKMGREGKDIYGKPKN